MGTQSSSTAQQPPSFRPMSNVTTVAHLSYCWALVFLATVVLGHSVKLPFFGRRWISSCSDELLQLQLQYQLIVGYITSWIPTAWLMWSQVTVLQLQTPLIVLAFCFTLFVCAEEASFHWRLPNVSKQAPCMFASRHCPQLSVRSWHDVDHQTMDLPVNPVCCSDCWATMNCHTSVL